MVPYMIRKRESGWWEVGRFYHGQEVEATFRDFNIAQTWCDLMNGKYRLIKKDGDE